MFFPSSLDYKGKIKDPNGNEIVNLPVSPFRRDAEITSYFLRKVPDNYIMRPDLIALIELGSVERTEFIMMFNQIGNPFSIDKDQVLLIPDAVEADTLIVPYDSARAMSDPRDTSIQDLLVQNYYKYSARNSMVDMSSYDKFLDTKIPSGNTDEKTDNERNATVPYLLNDEEEAMVIKDGRIYFNSDNDAGLQESEDIGDNNIDSTIQSILDGVGTDLSCSNCTYNGTNLSDFIKALNNNT